MVEAEQIESTKGVIVFSQLPPPLHGSTIMTQRLIEALDSLNFKVTLVERKFSRSADEIGKFQLRKVFSGLRLLVDMIRACRQSPNDPVLFFCTNRSFSFIVDCALSISLRILRVEQINYIHTSGYTELASRGFLWKAMTQILLRNATATVCLSDKLTKDIAPWTDLNSVHVIPNTVVAPKGLEHQCRAGSEVQIVYLSNLLPTKGADDFVEMARHLRRTNLDAKFIIAGAASDFEFLGHLTEKMNSDGLAASVTYIGELNSEEKWQFLCDSQILVFPSRYKYEAQPLVLIEAMAAGTAVVAYDIGGVSSIISDGRVGRLVPAGNFEMLVEATRSLAESPDERRSVCHAARARFEERFSFAAFRDSWEKVLSSQERRSS